MSWRDRDWARFNDEERRQLFGGTGRSVQRLPPSSEGAAHRFEPVTIPSRRPTRRRKKRLQLRKRVSELTLVALLAAGAIAYVVSRGDSVQTNGVQIQPVIGPSIPIPTPTNITSVPPPTNTVAIRWSKLDLAPAPHAGRICVTDTHHGRICASYVIGERPADTLTREIERRGLQVQSSG